MRPEQIHPTHDELYAYRDGELPAERRTVIEAHVMGCQACRGFIDEMSKLEAALRRRPDGVDEAYFESLPGTVLERIERGEVSPARPPEHVVPRPERRRADDAPASSGEDRASRRPRLPWAAILSTASAAGAVVVVIAILVNRGPTPPEISPRLNDTSKQATAPLVGEEREADKKVTATEPQAPVGGRAANEVAQRPGPSAAPPQKGSISGPTSGELAKLESKDVENAPGVPTKRAAPEALRSRKADEVAGQREPAEAPTPAVPSAEGESAYVALLRRYGLPPLWDPARVQPASLTSAEPALRALYQAGRAGSDSARVRLYLAEAARLHYAEAPDSALFETIVHHYLRAIRLGQTDSAAARVARERLGTLAR